MKNHFDSNQVNKQEAGTAQQFFKQSKFPGLTTKFNFVDRVEKSLLMSLFPFLVRFN